MAVKWLYTHWRWRGNSAVLINVGLLLGFFALDVRDLYYKTVWLGPYEDLAYDPHGVQPFDPEPLVPTLPVATLQSGDLMEQPSGWPSMLERCALLHGFGFFLAALGKNCSVGPAQYPIVVPELVLGASLRVDAVAWASCKLLYLHRRPRFCQMRGVSGFLHRYNLEDRRIPPSAMASEGSIAEMELLEFLAVITSSSPLERTVCVEGFAAVNGNVSAASIYGCGSPNIFKSVLAGHYATALHSLLYDKAWLAVDELNIMGVKFVIRQNSHLTSTYRVVEQSDGTSTRHTEIHSRANFSASGPLYCLVITTDIVLLLLHVHSALQIFRHALIPQLRRRQHAESGPRPQSMRPQNPPPLRRDATSTAIGQRWSHHVDFSMLSRSLYRSRPVVILTAITHLISWQVVIPSSVIWTWSVDTLDQLQSFNAVWDIVTGISERFAYAIARRAYVTTLELLGVGATVSYLIRDEVFAITTTKYDIDKQRYTDVFSFAGAVAYTNSCNDNQDAVWNTSWGLIGVVYKPLMRIIGLSILGLFLLLFIKASAFSFRQRWNHKRVHPTETRSIKLADYERLPLERLLNRPLRARSLIRTDLALETNINGELQLTIPTTFDSGFLVDDNGDLRPRRGFFDPIPASIDVRRLNAARRRRSASSTTVISLTGSDLLPAHRPLPRPPTFLQRLTTARARRHPTHLSSGNVPIR